MYSTAILTTHSGAGDSPLLSNCRPPSSHRLAQIGALIPRHRGAPFLLQFLKHFGEPGTLCIS